MTLIKLKDDAVTKVLPERYEIEVNEGLPMFPIYSTEIVFSVEIEFEKSETFQYEDQAAYINDSAVSDTINYLFSDTSKFKDLTAEEFKENLKKYLDSL